MASVASPTSLPIAATSHQRRRAISLSVLSSSKPVYTAGTIQVKIVDFGNACWVRRHFSEDIQTRQYRAPEVLIGHPYSTTADIWSLACCLFELATGDLLFDPHSSETFSKDDDHLAQIQELLGPLPKNVALGGTYSQDLFNSKGELRNIADLHFWPLKQVLMEKYAWPVTKATIFADVITTMLNVDATQRPSAAVCLNHPFFEAASSILV